jgi:hypothetical protein
MTLDEMRAAERVLKGLKSCRDQWKKLGAESRMKGKTLSDNPYTHEQLRVDWEGKKTAS